MTTNDMDEVFESYGGYDGWLRYAEQHYLPVLRHAALSGDTCPLSVQDRGRLGFLYGDIMRMCNYINGKQ